LPPPEPPTRATAERADPQSLTMNTTTALFYVFSAILLFSAFSVITAKSTVHAALYLVLAFFNAACLWMMLKAEFLSIALVLVYVGAVMVLFLFVVMMLDINTDKLRVGFWKRFPAIALVGLVIFFEMAIILRGGFSMTQAAPLDDPRLVGMDNSRQLGVDLFTNYLYPLQIAAVLLLVAIIAAIALTLRERKDTKTMDPSLQLKAKKADRVRLVRMAPEVPAVAAPAVDAAAANPASPAGSAQAAAPKGAA
jgi:NADH-quinone oxidoreductase subunit J